MEIFKIGHLSFSYPDQESNALDDISFSVNSGEFFTICGLSGCGKTTLLRHLKSSLSPHGTSSGSILFNGKPLGETDELTQASQIGFVMQSPENQSVTDKVWHELAFGCRRIRALPIKSGMSLLSAWKISAYRRPLYAERLRKLRCFSA